MGSWPNNCCCCIDGDSIPRWDNTTTVRPAGDSSPASYVSPFARYSLSDNTSPCGDGVNTVPLGSCGQWIYTGDKNGISSHAIDDAVDDIMACAADDTTHKKADHNCYVKTGTTSMKNARLGWQGILAQKQWHGRLGFNSKVPSLPNDTPPQTRYLSVKRSVGFACDEDTTTEYTAAPYYCDNEITYDYTWNVVADWSAEYSTTMTVGRYTGVIEMSNLVENHDATVAWDANRSYVASSSYVLDDGGRSGTGISLEDGTITDPLTDTVTACGWPDTPIAWYGAYQTPTMANWFNTWKEKLRSVDAASGNIIFTPPSYSTPNTYTWDEFKTLLTDQLASLNYNGVVTVTEEEFSDTRIYLKIDAAYDWGSYSPYESGTQNITLTLDVVLSSPYTAADCYQDWLDLFKEWDMSGFNLAKLRSDELLASQPLCVYDELTATNPDTILTTLVPIDEFAQVDDKTQAQVGGEWLLRDWFDDRAYCWLTPDGAPNKTADTDGGNTLAGPLFLGEKISHNQAGSDRHYWFGFMDYERRGDDCGTGASDFQWVQHLWGGESPTQLPPVSLRWQNKFVSQYDAGPFCNPVALQAGNFHQAFINQTGQAIIGSKHVQATLTWPAVNYGRPAGAGRYAVDQTTVCFFSDTTRCEDGTFNVKATGDAIAPLATGGLQIGDFVASDEEGFYEITDITDLGGGEFEITVDAKIDNLPTGWKMAERDDTGVPTANYIGKLRWVNYVRNSVTVSMPSPWEGRQAVTPSEASGTVTLTQTGGFTYYLKDVTTGNLPDLKIYNSSMVLLDTIAGTDVTRVGDDSVSFTHAAMPTAAYLVYDGYNWQDFDETPQRTGVLLTYEFNHRAAQTGYTSPPTWFSGTAGCTSCLKQTFTYPESRCPVMVGIVPHYAAIPNPSAIPNPPGNTTAAAVEDFDKEVLFDFTGTLPFDEVFGAHWQSEVDMVMVDPFWQQPFMPDGGVDYGSGESMELVEDDGSGNETAFADNLYTVYFPHRRWVEASSEIPADKYLPSSPAITLTYAADIDPAYWEAFDGGTFLRGLPIGDAEGNFGSFETPWGFQQRACATIQSTGNFYQYYQEFVTC